MNNATISRIGVVLYALVIGYFGVNHFLVGKTMVNYVPSFIPGGAFWVYLTGLALILAAISFLIGKSTQLAGILLAIFLLLIVFTIHLPSVIHAPDHQAVIAPMTNLVKDTGLAAAALIIAGRSRS
jgi:putative oxidoreductase